MNRFFKLVLLATIWSAHYVEEVNSRVAGPTSAPDLFLPLPILTEAPDQFLPVPIPTEEPNPGVVITGLRPRAFSDCDNIREDSSCEYWANPDNAYGKNLCIEGTAKQYLGFMHSFCKRTCNQCDCVPPEAAQHGFVGFQVSGQCFWVSHDRGSQEGHQNWANAKWNCDQQGGSLAIPNDPAALLRYIHTHIPNESLWLGASSENGVWRWINGTPLHNYPWGSGEPNHAFPDENCLELTNDAPCSREYRYICSKGRV